MFDGIYLDPDTINIEMIVIFLGFTCIVQLTKNVKLAFWGGGLTFVVAVLQTIWVIPFQYYWILTIILTLGTIAYGLRKNASAREELKGKLMDVEKSIFLLPLILIVGLGMSIQAGEGSPLRGI